MPKLSQYTDDYLAGNSSRGRGKGLTIGSFLSYQLSGRAKRWADVYHRSLQRSMELTPDAVSGRSAKGGIAWYRVLR